jgi:hypothetical protein
MMARLAHEAKEWDAKAEAREKQADFNRLLGLAVRRTLGPEHCTAEQLKPGLMELLVQWDKDDVGLKRVDFRRCARVNLKLVAPNDKLDKFFDTLSGGGGAAVVRHKALRKTLGALAVKAGKADPESEAQRSEAEGRRRDAEAVRSSLESFVRLEKNEAQLLALQDQSATPVVAQLGAVIIK